MMAFIALISIVSSHVRCLETSGTKEIGSKATPVMMTAKESAMTLRLESMK